MPDCKVTAQNLSDWFATEQGGYVLAREQAYFDRTVSDIFGYNALQLGLPEYDFLRTNRMPLRFSAGNRAGNDVRARNGGAEPPGAGGPASHFLPQSAGYAGNATKVRLSCAELPFDGASLDLVVIPHVLEFSGQPHQILREVERVLMPEGSLVISGFNPRSLWGMRRALGGKECYPWNGHFITLLRLKDWLALLGFEVTGGRFAAYAPPFQTAKWLERYAFMEKAGDRWWAVGGGVYFLHAIKRVPGMRLIKPQWNKRLVRNLLPVTPKLHNRLTQRRKTEQQ